MPNQDLSAPRLELLLLIAKVLNGLVPMLLEEALGVGFSIHVLWLQVQGLRTEVREPVAAGIVDEGTALRLHILERDPNPAHETRWVAVKMDGITVIRLFTANGKVECLKRKRFAPIQTAQQIQAPYSNSAEYLAAVANSKQ